MIPEEEKLKPCPFCGVYPVLFCNLTDWRGWPVYKPYANGCRPISYVLEARHKSGCFFYRMNGTNYTGRMSALNWECLVEAWNNRRKPERKKVEGEK